MNGRLSIFGVLLVALAIVAVWVGWQRDNATLIVGGALILAGAAWNTVVYLMFVRRKATKNKW